MSWLYVFVEGQTEEAFVKRVLAPHLIAGGLTRVIPLLFAGGGWKNWHKLVKTSLVKHKEYNIRFTTLFDLYGLPPRFPDHATLRTIENTRERALRIETILAETFDDERLIPYVQRHEFEALVLACLDECGWIFDAPGQPQGLDRLRRSLGNMTPEDVNDSPATAPSKRLIAHIPGYDKVFHGEMAIETVGLTALRQRCPGFDGWVSKLEAITATT